MRLLFDHGHGSLCEVSHVEAGHVDDAHHARDDELLVVSGHEFSDHEIGLLHILRFQHERIKAARPRDDHLAAHVIVSGQRKTCPKAGNNSEIFS